VTCSAGESTRSSPERPSSSANSRKTSSPRPWNVRMTASFSPIGVLMSTRSCISAAARSVKVTARIWCGLAAAEAMRCTIRAVSTWVLPVPAPATTSSGPPACSTARRCSGVRVCRMSGFGSASRKVSCSVIPTAPPGADDRSCVLLSLLRQVLRKGYERAHHRALWPLRRLRAIALEPERARDVEVRPFGAVLDGRFEERRGLDRAALAPRAVTDVRDLSFDLFAELLREGHGPEPVAGGRARSAHELDERVGFSEEPGVVVAKGHGDRAGERRDVDDAFGALPLGVGDAVDEHEPAFGGCVYVLD